MQNLAEFNRTMDAYAMAIKSGYGSIYQYADLIANNTEACWNLVQMIRFNDCQSFYCAWHDLKRSGDDSYLLYTKGKELYDDPRPPVCKPFTYVLYH